ncbi:MAG: hypothetical protein HC932_00485 [Thermales bacterium]|nr:hypothetical protein [Thermales bacterium]
MRFSKFNGSIWACANDNNTAYTAGDGLDLSGSVFSVDSPTCSTQQKLIWTGTTFSCENTLEYYSESTVTPLTAPSSTGTRSIAIGDGAEANGNDSITIGNSSIVDGFESYAFGDENLVNSNNSYAFGYFNEINGDNSYIIGEGGFINGDGNYIFGLNNFIDTVTNYTVIGNGNFLNQTAGIGAIIGNNNSTGITSDAYTFGANIFNSLPNSVQLGTSDATKLVVEQTGDIQFYGALKPNDLPGTAGQVLVSQGASTIPIWDDVSNIYTETDGVIGNEILNVGSTTGLLRAGTGTAGDPYTVDIKNCANNEILKYNTSSSTWDCAVDSGVGSETDGVIGNEILNVGSTGGLVRLGTGSNANPYLVDVKPCANNEILKYNTSTSAWDCSTDSGVGSETDGVIGNEVLNSTVSGGLIRAGTGTTGDPYTLGIDTAGVTNTMLANNSVATGNIIDNTILLADLASNSVDSSKIVDGSIANADLGFASVTSAKIQDLTIGSADIANQAITREKLQNCSSSNQILVYYATDPDGAGPLEAGWNCDTNNAITSEVDGIIGNEITNVGSTSALVRTGTGTSGNPYIVDVKACANNEILKYNTTSSTWTCSSDNNTAYTAGDGLSLIANEFSINSPTCAGTNKLQWNGTAFLCTADVDTTNFNIAANGGAGQNISNGGTVNFVDGTGTTATRTGNDISFGLTSTGVTPGTYNNVTTNAQGRITSASNVAYLTTETDGVIGNEVLNATSGEGLIRAGTGTNPDPYTLGIANSGVTLNKLATDSVNSSKIVDGSVSLADLGSNSVDSSKILNGSVSRVDMANCTTQDQILKYYVTDPDGAGPIVVGWNCVLDGSTDAWSLLGNSGTNPSVNFIGTTDNQDLVFRTNNAEVARYDNAGNFLLGTTSNPLGAKAIINSPGNNTGLDIKGNIDNYFQLNVQNLNNGSSASSDLVATANNGTGSSYYVNVGINGDGGATQPFTGPNEAYLYSSDTSLNIGAFGTGSELKFYTTNTLSSPIQRAIIDASGNFGIGTSTPTTALDVNGALRVRSISTTADSQVLVVDASGNVNKRAFPTASTGLQFVSDAFSLTNTGVTPGTYNNVTTDAQGRITSASNLTYLTTETDGVIGNEVFDVTVDGSITRTGTKAAGYALSAVLGTSIDTTEIVDGTVTLADLASNSVNSSKIVDGSVALIDLGSDSVNSSKIVNGSVDRVDMTNCASNSQILKYYTTDPDGAGPLTVGWNCDADATGLTFEVDGVIGNEVFDLTVGNGLTRTGTKAAGYTVNLDATTLGTTATTSSNSGLEVASDGLRLIGGCTSNQVLKWNGTAWACNADNNTGVTTIGTPTGSNANGGVITGNTLNLSFADTTNPGIVSTGTQTFAGNKTLNNNLNVNGNSTLGDSNTDTTTVTNFVNSGSTLNTATVITNRPTGGSVGTAPTTVDISTNLNINQTTANQTLTLPNPTNTANGRILYVSNTGSAGFRMLGQRVESGQTRQAIWSSGSWRWVGDQVAQNSLVTYKLANQTNSSTTLANDNEFTFQVGANETWFVNLNFTAAGTGTGGLKFAAQTPTVSSCSLTMTEAYFGVTANTTVCGATPTPAIITTWPPTSNRISVNANFTTTAAGTVTFQWAPNTATARTLNKDGYMQAFKLSGADYAELYYAKDGSSAGDIVELNGEGQSQISQSNQARRNNIIGVVSTKPGQVIGENDGQGSGLPIALSGRVPVKVTTKNNGPIKAGDPITVSDIDGVGERAMTSGRIIGKALTDFDGEDGTVVVFIETGFWQAPVQIDLSSIFGKKDAIKIVGGVSQEITQEVADLGLDNIIDEAKSYDSFGQEAVDEILSGFKLQQDQINELRNDFDEFSKDNSNVTTQSDNETTLDVPEIGIKLHTGGEIVDSLDLLNSIQPVQYKDEDGSNKFGFSKLGLLGDEESVDFEQITSILVKTVQDQQKQIDEILKGNQDVELESTNTGLNIELESFKDSFLAKLDKINLKNDEQDNRINQLQAKIEELTKSLEATKLNSAE